MTGWEAALWGVLGGGVAEAITLLALMRPTGRRRDWRLPWARPEQASILLLAVGLRLFASGVVAGALGVSGQLATAFTAFAMGAAAPLVVQRATQLASSTAEEVPAKTEAPPVEGSADVPN